MDFDYFSVGAADTEAPTTTHTLSPVDGSDGWHVTNPTLTLATEAGATTEYKLGDGAYQPYTAPVMLDASATVSYRSKDAAGNVEEAKTVTVKVDKAAPVTTASSTPAPGADGWISGAAKVTLAATDAGSGVASTQYAIDGGDWVTYTAPFDAPFGEHTLRVRSTDNAGLVETVKELALKVRQVSGGNGEVIGTVPATLALTLGPAASFGAFTPGVAREYNASTTATVVSSAGDATLSVADPSSTNTGHLVNGSFVMPQALQIAAGASAFRPPVRQEAIPHRPRSTRSQGRRRRRTVCGRGSTEWCRRGLPIDISTPPCCSTGMVRTR